MSSGDERIVGEAHEKANVEEEQEAAAEEEEESADGGADEDAAASVDGSPVSVDGGADGVGFGGEVGGIWAAAAGDVGLDALKRLSDERKALTAQRRRLRLSMRKEEKKRRQIMNLSRGLSDGAAAA